VAAVTAILGRLLGVDPVQWRALVWVSFISDLRQMKGSGLRLARAAAGSLGAALFSQLIYGAFCAALIAVLPNVFATSTIYYSLLLATLGLALLVDFTSVVLSPDDHVQLAPRPVDGRTFFVARLTSVIGFSLMLTTPFALLPAVAYLFRDFGGSLAGALASVAAAALCAVLVPLLVILLFLSLVQIIPAGRLHRALGYLQFSLSFFFIGAFFVLSRTTRALDAVRLEKSGLIYANPAAWFASWIELAEGRGTTSDWMAAAAPVVLLVVAGVMVRSRLSLVYAERLSTMFVDRPASASLHKPVPWLLFGPAHHAVGMLAAAQFRTDQKFRLGVLGILPLTVIYLLAGFSDTDGPEIMQREPLLVYYAVLFFPVMLRQFLVYSESWRAAWVFHAAPMPFDEVVVALKNTVVSRFLVPYLILVMLLLGWLYPRPFLEFVMHGVVVGLLSHALLTADLLVNPSLPFSQPTRQGSRSFALLLLMAPTMAIITTIPFWRPYLYASAGRTFLGVSVLVVVNVLLHELLLSRVERQSRQWVCTS
jgi:ABC-2 type transport system permease protein